MQNDQRLYIERSLAAQLSKENQPPSCHTEWVNAGFTFRILTHYDKILVVWRQGPKGPQVLGKLRITEFELDSRNGLGVCIESDLGSKPDGMQWVSHDPSRLFDLPVFAHVPFISEVTYIPESQDAGNFVVRVPLVFKTASNPSAPKLNDIYVTQIGEFRGRYPEFEDLKL